MIPTTKEYLQRAQSLDKGYDYVGRWNYLERAGELLAACVPLDGSVLELGPYRAPLVLDADYLDIRSDYGLHVEYHMDAAATPWPIGDNAYDAVVAMQVLEHLRPGSQSAVVAEMCRVARRCIVVSVPFLWERADADHCGIGYSKLREWGLGVNAASRDVTIAIADSETPRPRAIVRRILAK